MHLSEPWHSTVHPYERHIEVRAGGTVVARVPCNERTDSIVHQQATARRIAACVNACKGLDTEQLEAMVSASEPGVLATAYDVCSDIWESHGIDLVAFDHPDFSSQDINSREAVDTLVNVGPQVESVIFWARERGEQD